MLLRPRSTRSSLLPILFAAVFFACAPRASSKDTWIEVKSPNFTVISNAGEGEARRVAGQFEQFRELFQNTFPKLKVDLGKPLVIFAVKNEDSLRTLLPEFWETKGRVHPAGYYMPGEERHFVVVRSFLDTENPYEVVYHEYTHAIMGRNFQGLPVWFNEGLAEFFAHSTFRDKEVEFGKPATYHLEELRQGRLIPIDTLFQADSRSPYYNEQNRASIFYAESWAIVHYLLLDPDARKKDLLTNFLKAWDATGDQVEAAKKTFGDLKKFAGAMEGYARQTSFYFAHVKTIIHADPKTYAARPLPPAEVSAETALFYLHTNRPNEANAAVQTALQSDTNLALAHEAAGLAHYHQNNFPEAQKEFDKAVQLNQSSYSAYYFAGISRLRQGLVSENDVEGITKSLEKAIALDPEFAPSYATLSSFYAFKIETRPKAIEAGKKAVQLEPGNFGYSMNYGFVLLNSGEVTAAKTLAARMHAGAKTPAEQQMADQLADAAASHFGAGMETQSVMQINGAPSPSAGTTNIAIEDKEQDTVIADAKDHAPQPTAAGEPPPTPPKRQPLGQQFKLEGKVTVAECSASGELKLSVSINSVLMKFHAADFKNLEWSQTGKNTVPDKTACNWKGQKVRVTFLPNAEGDMDGELVGIYFF